MKNLASEENPYEKEPFLVIEIENTHYVVKKRDVRHLEKLDATRDFHIILKSKADLNFKIAKILTNAIGWRVDFEDYKQGKQTLLIPAKKFLDSENNRKTTQKMEVIIDKILEVKEDSKSDEEKEA